MLARTGEGATAAAEGSRIQQGHPARGLSCWSAVLYTQKQVGGLSPDQGTDLGFGLDPQVDAYRRLPINVFLSLTLSL